MPFTFHWKTQPVLMRFTAGAIVVIAIVNLGVGAKAWLASEGEAYQPVVADKTANIVQDNSRERIEAEVVTLTPTGFEPKEITRPGGPFLLTVSNRSGLEEVVLYLDLGGNRLHELRMSKKRREQKMVNLPPGQYILSEASHPDWICHITITTE